MAAGASVALALFPGRGDAAEDVPLVREGRRQRSRCGRGPPRCVGGSTANALCRSLADCAAVRAGAWRIGYAGAARVRVDYVPLNRGGRPSRSVAPVP